MKQPDWESCTEEELWHYVAWHLEGAVQKWCEREGGVETFAELEERLAEEAD